MADHGAGRSADGDASPGAAFAAGGRGPEGAGDAGSSGDPDAGGYEGPGAWGTSAVALLVVLLVVSVALTVHSILATLV